MSNSAEDKRLLPPFLPATLFQPRTSANATIGHRSTPKKSIVASESICHVCLAIVVDAGQRPFHYPVVQLGVRCFVILCHGPEHAQATPTSAMQ